MREDVENSKPPRMKSPQAGAFSPISRLAHGIESPANYRMLRVVQIGFHRCSVPLEGTSTAVAVLNFSAAQQSSAKLWKISRGTPLQVLEKNGSSGRTRTYNPPVNSCTDGKTANYRQLRLVLKIRLLRHFLERLSTANSERDSLKKSPKYFPASARSPTLRLGPAFDTV